MTARKTTGDVTQATQIDPKAKKRALDNALNLINKQFGPMTVMTLGDNNHMDVQHVSTGSLAFDYITGGGLARGRIHEFYGPEGSGKTSVALQTIATVQRQGGTAAFIDVEHALDPRQAARLGVDVKKLVVSQPNYAEQALDIMGALIGSGAVDIVVLDSVAALAPKAEIEGSMEDLQVGAIARIMGKALRKLTGIANKTDTIVVFINQVRDAVGVMYGNPEVTPGGKALKFYSSVRVRVSKGKQLIVNAKPVGQHVFLKCKKNKVGTPFLDAETDFYFRGGMDMGYDLMEYGTKFNVINKQGGSYCGPGGEILEYNGEPIKNKDTLKTALHDKSSGLQDLLYRPVLDAMQADIDAAFDDVDDTDEEDEYDPAIEENTEASDYANGASNDNAGKDGLLFGITDDNEPAI